MSRTRELTYRERSRRARKARARYVARCRRVLLAVAAAVMICTVFTTAVLQSRAAAGEDLTGYKYYKNIVISYDYDLTNAAADYADDHYDSERAYLHEVCQINHLASAETVRPGTHVIVPYYSDTFQ